MRIAAFVSDAQALTSAGVRIRYNRLRPDLAASGHELDVQVIDDVGADRDLDIDVGLITKIYDGRAMAIARRLRARGARVGIDVFDDYFSQNTDARFTPYRGWLSQMAGYLDFALCGTLSMQDRLVRLLPGLRTHVVKDPHDRIDPEAVAASVETAAARARRDGVVEVAWFGIGDNRHFQVGLEDLAAFGSHLSGFSRRGWAARLRVLTNPRAMTLERLERLARLPVPCEIEEWSETRQDALLRDSLVSFLPVNAQAFSTVKSMNRVVSALLGGTQVLSVGYPLYASVGELIYRDAGTIVDDLEAGRLRSRRATLPALAQFLARTGDSACEASGLAAFLEALPAPGRGAVDRPLVVVHGKLTTGVIHKTVQRLGGLSATHPFLPANKLDVDLFLRVTWPGVTVDLSQAGYDRLRPELRVAARPVAGPRYQLTVPADTVGAAATDAITIGPGLLGPAALYDRGLDLLRAAASHLFGAVELVVSEKAAPFGIIARPRSPACPPAQAAS